MMKKGLINIITVLDALLVASLICVVVYFVFNKEFEDNWVENQVNSWFDYPMAINT